MVIMFFVNTFQMQQNNYLFVFAFYVLVNYIQNHTHNALEQNGTLRVYY